MIASGWFHLVSGASFVRTGLGLIIAARGGFVPLSGAARSASPTPTPQLSIDLVRLETARCKVITQPFPNCFVLGMGFVRERQEQLRIPCGPPESSGGHGRAPATHTCRNDSSPTNTRSSTSSCRQESPKSYSYSSFAPGNSSKAPSVVRFSFAIFPLRPCASPKFFEPGKTN